VNGIALADRIEDYWRERGWRNVKLTRDKDGQMRSNLVNGLPRGYSGTGPNSLAVFASARTGGHSGSRMVG